MSPRPLLLSLALLSLASPALRAEAHAYRLDPVHSRLVFFVQHADFSRAIGTFAGLEGELRFDPDAPSSASVTATVPIASLDLGDAKWRKRILDPTFFDVKKHPQARFVSTRVEAAAEGLLRVTGTLTLHGVDQDVVLDVTPNRIDRHPLTLRHTAGFSARTTLSRFAFGMKKWKNLVGEEVEVLLEIEATRVRDAAGDD